MPAAASVHRAVNKKREAVRVSATAFSCSEIIMVKTMREIDVLTVGKTVEELCVSANMNLPCDLARRLQSAGECEQTGTAKSVISDICDNLAAAKELGVPICQDTGMAVVFLDIGQDVHFTGGDLFEAVNAGVRHGYDKGLLRKSVVSDPLRRENTGDNTPAVIHTRIVPGEAVNVTVAPKGFGSENMSKIFMLTPADGRQGVISAVVSAVSEAGSKPCPPVVVGVGIGGDFESCALLSKRALIRSTDIPNPDEYYAALERELLSEINKLGIGPQGFGGKTTALAVNIETAPTHIAGLPVAVNIGCHVTRHASSVI